MEQTDRPAKRQAARQRVARAGRMVFNNALSSFNVNIRDLSDAGAKLRQTFPFPAPELFDLVFEDPYTGQEETRACRMSWQRGDLIGVEFLEADISSATRTTRHVVIRSLD